MKTPRAQHIADADCDTLTIFAVDRGFCAHASAGKDASVLIDCGVNDAADFRPSSWLDGFDGAPPLSDLVLSVYQEDYIADLPGVLQRFGSATIHVNPSIITAWEPILANHIEPKLAEPGSRYRAQDVSLRGEGASGGRAPMTLRFFHNNYPEFTDSANLSVATLLSANTFDVLIGAGMGVDGWRALLRREDFRDRLRAVDVFVASSFGRRSGYCAELFEICEPRLIIVPDAACRVPVDTERYARHVSGLRFTDGSYRYILFTRADGMITISEVSERRSVIKTDAPSALALLARAGESGSCELPRESQPAAHELPDPRPRSRTQEDQTE
jgi:hypothetical protein